MWCGNWKLESRDSRLQYCLLLLAACCLLPAPSCLWAGPFTLAFCSLAQKPPRPRTETLHEIQQLLQQDNLNEAEKEVLKALKEFPGDAAFYDLLGVVEAKSGNYQT